MLCGGAGTLTKELDVHPPFQFIKTGGSLFHCMCVPHNCLYWTVTYCIHLLTLTHSRTHTHSRSRTRTHTPTHTHTHTYIHVKHSHLQLA